MVLFGCGKVNKMTQQIHEHVSSRQIICCQHFKLYQIFEETWPNKDIISQPNKVDITATMFATQFRVK